MNPESPYFLVVFYDDGSRFVVGIVMNGVVYHVTDPSQDDLGIDVATVCYMRRNQMRDFDYRFLRSPVIRRYDIESESFRRAPIRTAAIASAPDLVRTRVFPIEHNSIVPYYWAPNVPVDREVTIDESGMVISMGIDTRGKSKSDLLKEAA